MAKQRVGVIATGMTLREALYETVLWLHKKGHTTETLAPITKLMVEGRLEEAQSAIETLGVQFEKQVDAMAYDVFEVIDDGEDDMNMADTEFDKTTDKPGTGIVHYRADFADGHYVEADLDPKESIMIFTVKQDKEGKGAGVKTLASTTTADMGHALAALINKLLDTAEVNEASILSFVAMVLKSREEGK